MIPVAVCLAVIVIIILAIASWLIYNIKHHTTHRRNAQHVYDCVNHYPSPPQLPPPRIATTDNNPAYVQVELTKCAAYTSIHH